MRWYTLWRLTDYLCYFPYFSLAHARKQHMVYISGIHTRFIMQLTRTALVMDIFILACKYFLDSSTRIWLAANPARCSWATSLSYSSFPTFLVLFQHYLAHCLLVVQQEISADMLFFALLPYGQSGLRRSHEKVSFYILVTIETHTHTHTYI